MSDVTTPAGGPAGTSVELAEELVARARAEGVELVGPGGLLTDLTKTVLETALEVEMEDHLGYPKHAVEGRDRGNSRNGTRSKTVLTEVGEVEIHRHQPVLALEEAQAELTLVQAKAAKVNDLKMSAKHWKCCTFPVKM